MYIDMNIGMPWGSVFTTPTWGEEFMQDAEYITKLSLSYLSSSFSISCTKFMWLMPQHVVSHLCNLLQPMPTVHIFSKSWDKISYNILHNLYTQNTMQFARLVT